jgi:hypothetical protein
VWRRGYSRKNGGQKKIGWSALTITQRLQTTSSLITTALCEVACLRGSIAEAVQDVDVAAFKVETGTDVTEAIVAERMRRSTGGYCASGFREF